MSAYRLFGKRFLDLVLAGLAIALLSPFMAIAGLAILLEDGRPVLFVHDRVGRRQELFRLMKFRSMRTAAANVPSQYADDSMVTRVGGFLRRTNLDELPQLFNILRGEMSVVGPRPAVASQRELIALRTAGGVYELRPGLTGLAQIRAYDGMPDHEKALHDVEYARTVSVLRDMLIILRTIGYLRKPPPKY